jgi:hypothetical protein
MIGEQTYLLAAKSSPARAALLAGGVCWRPEGGAGTSQVRESRFSLKIGENESLSEDEKHTDMSGLVESHLLIHPQIE